MNKNDKVSGHVRERQGVNGVSRQLVINYKDPATGKENVRQKQYTALRNKLISC